MHKLEKAFIDLLRGHLTVQDNKIYTGNRYRPSDITPCVNVSLADESIIKQKYVEIDNVQYISKRYSADIWINIWCNSEEERQTLITEINNRILKAEANHYSACANFNPVNSKCNATMNECEALNTLNGRTNKKQCPNLQIYQSFFKHNNIVKRTFSINSVTDLDELDTSETILRTIFKTQMEYYTFYRIGGKTYDSINIREDLL